MKVHVTNIATAGGRVRKTNLSIQIRSVEVNLTTVFVYDIARCLDTVLEHTEGGWVCDLRNRVKPGNDVVPGSDAHHESREVVFMLFCLRTEVHDVETAVR